MFVKLYGFDAVTGTAKEDAYDIVNTDEISVLEVLSRKADDYYKNSYVYGKVYFIHSDKYSLCDEISAKKLENFLLTGKFELEGVFECN